MQQLASRYPPVKQQTKENHGARWPVLIYCRGGLGNYGGVNTAWLEQFVNKGYIVFAPSYRGNEGAKDMTNMVDEMPRMYMPLTGLCKGGLLLIPNEFH